VADLSPDVVPQEALRFFSSKGLRPRFSYLDVWREEHSVAFTVAKVLERDILETVQGILTKAIETGTTFRDFVRDVKPELEKSGWIKHHVQRPIPTRLKTIWETNLRTAHAAGQWQRVQRTKAAIPYLEYMLGPSEQHREQHVAWAGTILPVDDPWWLTHMPPNGWGCKCWVAHRSRISAERRGGVTARPEEEMVPWQNPKTGVVEMVPKGIDPGFDYNPGINRLEGVQRAEGET